MLLAGVATLPALAGGIETQPLLKARSNVEGVDYLNISGSPEQIPILEQNGQGIGLIDYDNDGRVDLFVPNGSTESRWRKNENPGCRLYRNLGDWRFEDVTETAGVRGNDWSTGVAIADYDADGDLDVYVLNWGPNVLYRNNGDKTFTDVTKQAGVGHPTYSSSAAFADFNGDHKLDIYVSNYVRFGFEDYPKTEKDGSPCLHRGVETGCGPWCYEGLRDVLYLQQDDHHFRDKSRTHGLATTDGFRGFGVVATDIDGDGDADVYVGCDVMPNLYLENLVMGHFGSVGHSKGGALNSQGQHESGMGVAAGDYFQTRGFTLFTTNFASETNTAFRVVGENLADATALIGFDKHAIEMGWGVIAQDFNQDGRVDVFVANGHIYPQVDQLNDPADRYAQPPRLYLQREDNKLKEVDTVAAFGKPVRFSLRGCAAGDLDNDGDLDVVAVQHNGPLVFFENRSNKPSLMVELMDRHGGRSPMGAVVRVEGAASQRMLPNQGYQSSQDHRLHFAIARNAEKIKVNVKWPDLQQESFQVTPEQGSTVTLIQGKGDQK